MLGPQLAQPRDSQVKGIGGQLTFYLLVCIKRWVTSQQGRRGGWRDRACTHYLGRSQAPAHHCCLVSSQGPPRQVWGPSGPWVEKGQAGRGVQAGGGGKARLVGTRGRRAAAWPASQGCPAWSPHPAHPAGLGPVLQTENPVLGLQGAGAAVRQVYTGGAGTLKEECCEVGSRIVLSTGLGGGEVSSLGNPSCDPKGGAGEKVLAPQGASRLAPRVQNLQHRGYRSRLQSALGSGTCRVGTYGQEGLLGSRRSLGVGLEHPRAWEEGALAGNEREDTRARPGWGHSFDQVARVQVESPCQQGGPALRIPASHQGGHTRGLDGD